MVSEVHKVSRKKVCCICFNKAGSWRKPAHNVTPTLEYTIKLIIPSYSVNDDSLPTALCNSCYMNLSKDKITKWMDYTNIKICAKRGETTCTCKVCKTGNSKDRQFNYNVRAITSVLF